ncbi:MAG: hypothetical protein IJS26_05700 [Alphaproteobacteria bacterium]|nr:hypothetical protein [Alphaproteobacteria bacterium]
MFFKSKAMNIREVTEYITNSFRKTTPYQVSGTSLPRVVNLLETPKKAKSETIEQIYNEYIKYGRESVVLVSLSHSCHCFQWSISHATQICFWRGRIYANPNKRIDLLVLVFSRQQLII